MKNLILTLIAFISISTQAQLGNLLKKSKEKLTEKKYNLNNSEQINQTKNMSLENQEILFEFPYQGFDYSNPIKSSLATMISDKDIYSPFKHIRKQGDPGIVHFAKDYPEIKSLVQPYDNNLKIEFFEALPNSGKETFTNLFSSHNHIYARITALSGTIKSTFNLDDKEPIILMKIILYDDEKQSMRFSDGNNAKAISLSIEQANLKSLDIDIMPHTMKYSVYSGISGEQIFYSPFPNMHNQNNFSKNGNYKVGVFFNNKTKDDWGKEQEGDGIIYGNTFEYDFNAKDVPTIMSEQDALYNMKKTTIARTLKELPVEWKLKTSLFTMGLTAVQIGNLYKNSFSDPESLEIIKVYSHPSSGGWTVQKNEFGIPLYRYSNQFYTLFVKNKQGDICYFTRFSLRQQYNGGGTYNMIIGDTTYDVNFTDCLKIK